MNTNNKKIKHQIRSGTLNEDRFVSVIKNHTTAIYRNKRVPTILTDSGSTEIDIIFYYQNTIFIIEAKNVISLDGNMCQKNWRFISKTANYIALNPIIQNKIHVRAFKNNFYKMYKYYPRTESFVVVPANTYFDINLNKEILTLPDLDMYLFNYTPIYDDKYSNNYIPYHLKRMF